ncbi:hypothetical protein BSKO_09807 [Bryopsis sp. KO-2023]|nr:hypothetical protein BSKO_09807 [Bryopsis sp. KO-2023]
MSDADAEGVDVRGLVAGICSAVFDGDAVEESVQKISSLKQQGVSDLTDKVAHRLAILWELADSHVEGKKNGEAKDRIVKFVRALDHGKIIDRDKWLATSELEFLEDVGFINSAADFRKKEVRYYTKAVYLQKRYNLMRECSEGFAKVACILNTLGGGGVDVRKVQDELRLVIGYFHLDPHRVLDLLLESLPANNADGSYAVLDGDLFDKIKLTHLLGWKFDDCHSSGNPTPTKLFDVAATLISGGYVDFQLLFAYLRPTSQEFLETVSQQTKKLRAEIQKIEKPSWEKKQSPQGSNGSMNSARKGHFNINRANVRVLETCGKEFLAKDHQVLNLAAAFLRREPLTDQDAGWAHALMKQATEEGGETSVEMYCLPYCNAMLGFVERTIDPVYKKLFGGEVAAFASDPLTAKLNKPIIPSIMENRDLAMMIQFLTSLGHHMATAPSTLSKVCWVLAHEAKFYSKFDCSDWTFMVAPPELKPMTVELIIAECLIPSLSCLPNCIQLAEDIYRVLKFLPYSMRFLTYTNAIRSMNSNDITYATGLIAERAAKQIIRRISNSEDRSNRDTVQSACQFRKLGVHAPFSVTAVLVSRAMSDDNLQEGLSQLMAQQMPLAFDAFAFWVIYHFTNTKDRKVDGGDHSWWFKRLAKFMGKVCKEYSNRAPLVWLVQSIIKEVYAQEIGDFHLIEELLGHMTGFTPCAFVGENQLAALAGGPLLKSVILTMPWHKDKSYSIPSRVLVEVLGSPATGLPSAQRKKESSTIITELVVLLNNAISCAPYMMESSNVKFTMEVCDRVMDTYTQLIDFLSYHLTREEYYRLMPSLQDLVNVYNCPPDWVFYAYRNLIIDIRDSERKEEGEICIDVEADEVQNATVQKLTFQWMVQEVLNFREFQEKGVWEALTPEFFTLFWSLTLSDLRFPEKQYAIAEADLEAHLKIIRDRLLKLEDRNRHNEDRTRREERRNLEREKEYWKDRLRQLHAEKETQKRRVEHVRGFVRSMKDTILASIPHSKFKELETALVQYCIFPRLKMGLEEGQFTWEFLMFVHEMGLVNFHTVILLDRVVKEVFPMMHSMTDREGAGFRVFMGSFLKKMESWRADEKLFESECGGRGGCAVNVFTAEDKNKKMMDHTGLQRLNYKWVNRLSRTLKDFLEPHTKNGEDLQSTAPEREKHDVAAHRYVLRRSGLLMLNHVGKFFPVLKGLANHLKTAACYVKDNSEDDQLKNMANHFYTELEKEFERQDRWVELKNFGGLPPEKLNALKQRDRSDTQSQQPQDTQMEEAQPSNPPESGAHEKPTPAGRSQPRESERRSQRRPSPIPPPSAAVKETQATTRDREGTTDTGRERDPVGSSRERERPSRTTRLSTEQEGSGRAETTGAAENQGRSERPKRAREDREPSTREASRRRTAAPVGRSVEEEVRRYNPRPRRN